MRIIIFTELSPERQVKTAESPSRSHSPNSPNKVHQHHNLLPCTDLEHTALHYDNLRQPRSRYRSKLEEHSLEDSPLDCPEELYNLTKLAEVSLAAAAGHVFGGRYFYNSDKEVHNYFQPLHLLIWNRK